MRRRLCKDCYNSAYKLVRSGKETWESLIRLGLAGPTRAQAFPTRFREVYNQLTNKEPTNAPDISQRQ